MERQEESMDEEALGTVEQVRAWSQHPLHLPTISFMASVVENSAVSLSFVTHLLLSHDIPCPPICDF